MNLPRIAITMGDPAGVGPEICLRALAEVSLREVCVPVVFGDVAVLRACSEKTGIPLLARVISAAELAECAEPAVLDFGAITARDFVPGAVNAATGRAAFRYVNAAIDEALAGRVAAVATAPVSKAALHLAGHHFPGHTEIFASRTEASRSCMMQYSEEITCAFVTTHIGYAEVARVLTTRRILDVIELSAEALTRIRGRAPRIVVCGLNPHAGESGLFGAGEEERIIAPAIEAARARGLRVEGPLPADTAFITAKRRTTDVFVCMYHDQGHIPVKALVFDCAVNTTLGLPIVRTSVDHGTAADIAWHGVADAGSLFHAIRLAVKLSYGTTSTR